MKTLNVFHPHKTIIIQLHDNDYRKVKSFQWIYDKKSGGIFRWYSIPGHNKEIKIWLHRSLFGFFFFTRYIFLDGNPFNYQRSNIKIK